MAAVVPGPDEEDDLMDPIKMFLPEEPADVDAAPSSSSSVHPQSVAEHDEEHQLKHHHLRSVNYTVVTRQLHSQGLSFQLWPAATTLVGLLDDTPSGPLSATLAAIRKEVGDERRLRILELGSGTGFVGIVAAATLSADVTVTDLPHVLPNLQFNADANAAVVAAAGGSLKVAPLRWGEPDDADLIGREFDLVLASDVVYYDYLYEPLLKTLQVLFEGCDERKGMVFVMAHLRRWKKDSAFFKKARKLFNVEVIHVDDPPQGSRTGVTVYRFQPKV